jgi:hypothetical protein
LGHCYHADKAEHAYDHKSDIVSAPGNSPVAGLHLQLAHIITGPRTAPDGGDPFLVYGDVEEQFLLAHQGVYEVVRGERPVNTVALRVVGVHLVARRISLLQARSRAGARGTQRARRPSSAGVGSPS